MFPSERSCIHHTHECEELRADNWTQAPNRVLIKRLCRRKWQRCPPSGAGRCVRTHRKPWRGGGEISYPEDQVCHRILRMGFSLSKYESWRKLIKVFGFPLDQGKMQISCQTYIEHELNIVDLTLIITYTPLISDVSNVHSLTTTYTAPEIWDMSTQNLRTRIAFISLEVDKGRSSPGKKTLKYSFIYFDVGFNTLYFCLNSEYNNRGKYLNKILFRNVCQSLYINHLNFCVDFLIR